MKTWEIELSNPEELALQTADHAICSGLLKRLKSGKPPTKQDQLLIRGVFGYVQLTKPGQIVDTYGWARAVSGVNDKRGKAKPPASEAEARKARDNRICQAGELLKVAAEAKGGRLGLTKIKEQIAADIAEHRKTVEAGGAVVPGSQYEQIIAELAQYTGRLSAASEPTVWAALTGGRKKIKDKK
jgi:hypothetical protein